MTGVIAFVMFLVALATIGANVWLGRRERPRRPHEVPRTVTGEVILAAAGPEGALDLDCLLRICSSREDDGRPLAPAHMRVVCPRLGAAHTSVSGLILRWLDEGRRVGLMTTTCTRPSRPRVRLDVDGTTVWVDLETPARWVLGQVRYADSA